MAPIADPEPEPEPEDPYAGWRTYRHSNGGSFRYPPDWRLQESVEGLRLEPPGFDSEEELILVLAAPALGISDANDPSVVVAIDQQFALTLPDMRRRGGGQAVAWTGGEGRAFDYRGRTPDGRRAECRVWVAVHDGLSVGFSLLTTPDRFDAHAATVAEIFSTLAPAAESTAAGEAKGGDADDGRLVGVFAGEAIASSSGVYMNTQLVYALNSDGSVLYGAQSSLNASKRDIDGNLLWTADGQTDESVATGRWSARGGFLSLDWSDGTRGYFRYGFEPDGSLVLRNPTTGELINFYARVQ